MDLNQILSMLSPSQQQSLQGMRGVNAMSPADAAMAVEQRGLGGGGVGIPPELAQMMAQRQTIQAQLPQNQRVVRSQMSDQQLELPPLGLDAMRNSPDDPTGLAGRMARMGPMPMEQGPQEITPQQQIDLDDMQAAISFLPRNAAGTSVMSSPNIASMLGQASRLASLPGAQDGDLPGLAGNSQAVGGIAGQMASITKGRQMRDAKLAANPELAAKMAAREQAAGAEQERRQGIVTDRARLRADRREGITPQMRLLDQMVQGKGGGGGDNFMQSALLYGPDVAARMAEGKANRASNELIAQGKTDPEEVRVRKAQADAMIDKAATEKKTANRGIASKLDPDDPLTGSYTDLDPETQKEYILSTFRGSGNKMRQLLETLEAAGVPMEHIADVLGDNPASAGIDPDEKIRELGRMIGIDLQHGPLGKGETEKSARGRYLDFVKNRKAVAKK